MAGGHFTALPLRTDVGNKATFRAYCPRRCAYSARELPAFGVAYRGSVCRQLEFRGAESPADCLYFNARGGGPPYRERRERGGASSGMATGGWAVNRRGETAPAKAGVTEIALPPGGQPCCRTCLAIR